MKVMNAGGTADVQLEWLTTEEVASLLRKPKSWVFNNAGPLGIPRVQLGRQYRYPRAGVDEWLADQLVSA